MAVIEVKQSDGSYKKITYIKPKSAYELACANGFVGTEKEWIASLKGATGPQGPQGAKGATGATGSQGPKGDTGATGPTGPQGPKGDTGAKGATGATGSQGPKGDPGDTGEQGPQGPKGDTGAKGATGSSIKTLITSYSYNQSDVNKYGADGYSGIWTVTSVSGVTTGDTVLLRVTNSTKSGYAFIVGVVTAINTSNKTVTVSSKGLLDKGESGAQGVMGPKGDQGIQGLTGAKGATGAQGAKGDTGAQGAKGDTGAQGASVTKEELWYYVSTSSTSQSGGSWSTTYPSYTAGKYLWKKIRAYLSNNTTVDTVAYRDTTWDTLKETKSTISSFQQTMNGFETRVTEVESDASAATQASSAVKQSLDNLTAEFTASGKTGVTQIGINGIKVKQSDYNGYTEMNASGFKVNDGSSDVVTINNSGLTITGNIIANKGSFKNINVDSDFQWNIDEEGNLNVVFLGVQESLSCTSLNAESVDCSTVVQRLDEDKSFSISGTGLSDALGSLPQDLGFNEVTITFTGNVNENLRIDGFSNGTITVNLNSKVLNGYIRVGNSNCKVIIKNGTVMPATGYTMGSNIYSILVTEAYKVDLDTLSIYPGKTGTNVCIGATQRSNVYLNAIKFMGSPAGLVITQTMARLFSASGSTGLASATGWRAWSGSEITLTGSQGGGKTNSSASSGGIINATGVTFATSANSGTNTNTSNTSTDTVSVLTCTPTYLDCYRHTVYNNWKKDGVMRQGNWGYGNCEGFAFYGTQFAKVKGKTIKKVVITLTRNSSAGSSGSVSHPITYHTYTARTTGEPTSSSTGSSVSMAWGATSSVTITNSTVLNALSAGTLKGFGIKSSYSSGYYSSVSGGKVQIYYVGD